MKRIILLGSLLLLNACGAVMNPYYSEFECPQIEKGKCVGVGEAYREAIQAEKALQTGNYTFSLLEKESLEEELVKERELLRKQIFEKMSGVLRDPQTPILLNPQVIRILILPYAQGKTLYMGRYVYVVLEEPRWLFDNLILEGWEKE
ncbi:MAG: TraV family lipoprotein [Candidatus Bathyarchaeia archaeon]